MDSTVSNFSIPWSWSVRIISSDHSSEIGGFNFTGIITFKKQIYMPISQFEWAVFQKEHIHVKFLIYVSSPCPNSLIRAGMWHERIPAHWHGGTFTNTLAWLYVCWCVNGMSDLHPTRTCLRNNFNLWGLELHWVACKKLIMRYYYYFYFSCSFSSLIFFRCPNIMFVSLYLFHLQIFSKAETFNWTCFYIVSVKYHC